jgi:hypothetical protein
VVSHIADDETDEVGGLFGLYLNTLVSQGDGLTGFEDGGEKLFGVELGSDLGELGVEVDSLAVQEVAGAAAGLAHREVELGRE